MVCVTVYGHAPCNIRKRDFILNGRILVSIIELPYRRFEAFHDISLSEKLIGKLRSPQSGSDLIIDKRDMPSHTVSTVR